MFVRFDMRYKGVKFPRDAKHGASNGFYVAVDGANAVFERDADKTKRNVFTCKRVGVRYGQHFRGFAVAFFELYKPKHFMGDEIQKGGFATWAVKQWVREDKSRDFGCVVASAPHVNRRDLSAETVAEYHKAHGWVFGAGLLHEIVKFTKDLGKGLCVTTRRLVRSMTYEVEWEDLYISGGCARDKVRVSPAMFRQSVD